MTKKKKNCVSFEIKIKDIMIFVIQCNINSKVNTLYIYDNDFSAEPFTVHTLKVPACRLRSRKAAWPRLVTGYACGDLVTAGDTGDTGLLWIKHRSLRKRVNILNGLLGMVNTIM